MFQRQRTRANSLFNDGEMLIKMFKRNEKGFVKNKEMKMHSRQEIFGLNPPQGKHFNQSMNKGPAFDALIGEQLKKIVKKVQCEHNFNPNYLKFKNEPQKQKDGKKLLNRFHCQVGCLVITNYRMLFVANSIKDKDFEQLMQDQPRFVHEFFNVPVGLICRIDKQVNLAMDHKNQNNLYNYNNNIKESQNQIEVYTKDNRHFKLTFGATEN